jgi:protein-S-isoprenylcysteine O-methyltransferase Ste14
MRLIYHWLFPVVWWSFAVYWFISARWARKIKINEPPGVRLAYQTVAWVAAAIIVFHGQIGILNHQLWPQNQLTFFIGAALLLAGLGFAIWARIHIGQFWSATVALKEDHQLIRSGPYALVRHPIYTGILTGLLGTAIALGQLNGCVALTTLHLIFLWKSRREEHLMIQAFGEEYIQYRRQVPAFLPLPRP